MCASSPVPEDNASLVIHAEAARRAARDNPRRGRELADAVIAQCGPHDVEARAVALRARGWAERELYLYEESRSSLNASIRLARRSGLSDRLAEALISRSGLNLELGRRGAAERDVVAARQALGGRSTPELESHVALLEMAAGHFARSVASGLRARSQIAADTDPIVQAVILINLGEALSHLGRWSDADAVLTEAHTVADGIGRLYLGMVIQTRAAAAVRCGHLAEGIAAFDRAEEILTEAGWPLGEHYLERIDSLVALCLTDEAEDAVRRAISYCENEGMGLMMRSEVRLREACQLRDAGLHEASAFAAADAADLFRRQRRVGYAALADIVRVAGRVATGTVTVRDLRRVERAAEAMAQSGSYADSLDAHLVVAAAARVLGRFDAARSSLGRVRSMSRRGGPLARFKGRVADVRDAEITGDVARLRRAARRGLEEVARLRMSVPNAELRAHVSGHGVELAIAGLRSVLDSRHPERIFEWIERGRLASILTAHQAPHDAELDDTFAALREVMAGQKAMVEDPGDAVRLRAAQARLETRIQRRLRALDPTGVEESGVVVSAREVVDLLRGSLLVIAVLDDRLLAVMLGDERGTWDLGPLASVSDEVTALQFALRRVLRARSDPSRDVARASIAHSLRRLDEILVAPLAERLSPDVVVVPPARLFSVPWHALPSLERRRVVAAPSATVWARAHEAEPAGSRTLAAAGPRLASAAAEVRAIGRLVRDAVVLGPREATVGAVRDGLGTADVAHLACHGSFRADNPGFSSLELADGPLTVLDLETLGRAPGTMVLASCDSGASRALPGDELRGFVSALLGLGTRSVVASAVPIPDCETTLLMVPFHRHLAAGASVGVALDDARSALDTGTPEGLVLATAFAHYGAG